MFLLDSNAWIVHLRSNFTSRLSQKLLANRTSIVTCSVVRGELLTGAYKSNDPARNVARVESVLPLSHPTTSTTRRRRHMARSGRIWNAVASRSAATTS